MANPPSLQDHIHNKRGKMVYHMELIALLASICAGDNQIVKSTVRDMLSMHDITHHLVSYPDLPLPLRSAYLGLLDQAYIETYRLPDGTAHEIGECLPQLLSLLTGLVQGFVDEHLNPDAPTDFTEDEAAYLQRSFVCGSVLPVTARALTCKHFVPALQASDEMDETCVALANAANAYLAQTRNATDELLEARTMCKDVLSQLRARSKLEGGATEASDRLSEMDLVDDLADIDVTGNAMVAGNVNGSAVKPKSVAVSPQEKLLDFIEDWDHDEVTGNAKDEFRGLVAVRPPSCTSSSLLPAFTQPSPSLHIQWSRCLPSAIIASSSS